MEITPKLFFQLEGSFAKLINDCETELKRQIHGSISLGMFYHKPCVYLTQDDFEKLSKEKFLYLRYHGTDFPLMVSEFEVNRFGKSNSETAWEKCFTSRCNHGCFPWWNNNRLS